jgi:rhamnosyltransferase
MRIAAYITAYEDRAAIETCVTNILHQSLAVEHILVVDNSQKPVVRGNDFAKVSVFHHPENVGVGGGLCLGLQWAIATGYDLLWMFDQDSIPAADCLEKLLQVYQEYQKFHSIGIVAPTAVDPRNNTIIEGAYFDRDRFLPRHPPNSSLPYPCDAPITSGSLLNLQAASKISPPNADLFIDGVDMDYGWRLVQAGYRNFIVPQAILTHSFGNPIHRKLANCDIFLQKYPPLRHYYICRNHTYLAKHYAPGIWLSFLAILRRCKYALHTIILLWLFESDRKYLSIWACFVGTWHGIRGKLGKIW